MKFLICEDADHAAAIDAMIFDHLRDQDGARGGSWSGVYTDGTRYGVLWDSPASGLFGDPATDPSIVVFDDVDGDWSPYVHPADPAPSL